MRFIKTSTKAYLLLQSVLLVMMYFPLLMPTSTYQQALGNFDAATRAAIEAGIAALDAQLQANIENETALMADDLISLLQRFFVGLSSQTAVDAWISACRAHSCKGKIVPDDFLPVILGRVVGLKTHAKQLAALADGDFDADEAAGLLRKYTGANSAPYLIDFLREAKLGNHTLWATFHLPDSTQNPLQRLPNNHADICAALGLKWAEALVGFAWNHQLAGAPPLFRPTIADAAENPLFRPWHEAASHWGYTGPLSTAFEPQPEFVLQSITCKGLTLPYMVYEV